MNRLIILLLIISCAGCSKNEKRIVVVSSAIKNMESILEDMEKHIEECSEKCGNIEDRMQQLQHRIDTMEAILLKQKSVNYLELRENEYGELVQYRTYQDFPPLVNLMLSKIINDIKATKPSEAKGLLGIDEDVDEKKLAHAIKEIIPACVACGARGCTGFDSLFRHTLDKGLELECIHCHHSVLLHNR